MIFSILAGMFGGFGGAIVALFATGANLVAGDTLQKASEIATQIASLSLTLTVMLISSFCKCVSRSKSGLSSRPRRVDYLFEESSTVGTKVGTCIESTGSIDTSPVPSAPSELMSSERSSGPTSAAEAAAVAT